MLAMENGDHHTATEDDRPPRPAAAKTSTAAFTPGIYQDEGYLVSF